MAKLNKTEQDLLNSRVINNNAKFALTTIDNPYDPFTQYWDWYKFDNIEHDYNSSGYLARIARTSDALSDYENNIEIERAIDEILKYNFTGIYKKVVNENYKEPNLDEE